MPQIYQIKPKQQSISSRKEKNVTTMTREEQSNIPLITCAILAAVTTGGPAYAFGIYSVELKNSLNLTQTQLDTLSSAYFCAGLFSWIPGLLVDRYGVRRAMSMGGIAGASLMMAYWAVARQFLHLPSTACVIATLFILSAGFCISNGLVIGSIYKILVCSSATTNKGSAVGVAKGYVGLGSGVYACLFHAMKAVLQNYNSHQGGLSSSNSSINHRPSDLDFLPMAAVISLLGAATPALLWLPSQEETTHLWNLPKTQLDKTTKLHFLVLYMGLLALAGMVMSTSLGELFTLSLMVSSPRHTASSHVSKGILLLALWLGPILALRIIPTAGSDNDAASIGTVGKDVENYGATMEHSPLLQKEGQDRRHHYFSQRTETTLVDDSERGIRNEETAPVENYQLTQLLQTPHAWILLWIALVSVGGGTMMTNNMGQMVESLALEPQDTVTPAVMAIFSVAQATSRIVTGAVSDAALARYGTPRPTFLIVASLIGASAHALLALTDNQQEGLFLCGVMLAGIAFGMIWPLMVLIVGEVFGTAHMATNYLFYDGAASAVGTLLLSKFITQEVYEAHIHDSSIETTCYGPECFALSNWAAVALALSSVLACIPLLRQTSHIYNYKAETIGHSYPLPITDSARKAFSGDTIQPASI
jgi:MFS family permease